MREYNIGSDYYADLIDILADSKKYAMYLMNLYDEIYLKDASPMRRALHAMFPRRPKFKLWVDYISTFRGITSYAGVIDILKSMNVEMVEKYAGEAQSPATELEHVQAATIAHPEFYNRITKAYKTSSREIDRCLYEMVVVQGLHEKVFAECFVGMVALQVAPEEYDAYISLPVSYLKETVSVANNFDKEDETK